MPIRRKAPGSGGGGLEGGPALLSGATFSALGDPGPLGVRAAQLGGPAGEAGARDRTRGFAFGAIGGHGRRRGQLWLCLLDAEDLLLALALQQGEELLLLHRLPLDEDLGDLDQVVLVFGEDVLPALVGRPDDSAHLLVDFAA